MSHVEIEEPTTQSKRLRTFIRQNSDKVSSFAEDVVLPRQQRSLKRIAPAQDVELGVVREQADSSTTAQPTPKLPAWAAQSPAKKAFPVFMVVISLIQALAYYYGGELFWLYLGYDPYRRHEVWRFLTIMFVHSSASHLWGNLVFQLILGVLLEIVHHWKRIAIIYTACVLGGTLFITVFTPNEYGAGASAGVYGLLFAHVATILLNWNEMDRKCCRVFWLLAYISFDVGLTLYSELVLKTDSNISHVGHFGGALTGFLISILVLKNFEEHPWEKTFQKICAAILITLAVIIVIINIAFPSMYSKSEFNTNYEETFLIRVFKIIDESPNPSKSPILIACLDDKDCAKAWDQYKKTGKVSR